MNKKILFIIIPLIIIFIAISLIYINTINNNDHIETFDSSAKYIWINDGAIFDTTQESEDNPNPNKNSWVYFRKNFNIKNKRDIKNATALIAADSKYFLYINGNIVIRDGELKRGEKENSIYYDEISIENYLQKGENNISILVWYFGKDGFSHIDSGKGALLFEAQIGNTLLVSDDSWKAIKSPSFLDDNTLKNGRLSEANILYNSNLELNGWTDKDFDDTSWSNAYCYGSAGDMPWGELIKRDIPFFKYSDIKKYVNSQDYENKTFEEDTLLEMKLDYNIQLVPYFKISSDSDKEIVISNNPDLDNKSFYGKISYITQNGEQSFEAPTWINGDKIYYYIPKGVKILELGFRETGYDVQNSGSFECDNNNFNVLWQMARKTLYVNMRETYMDCPDRERALWIADASSSMEQSLYSFDSSVNALYEKCIKMFIGWKHENVIPTVAPSYNAKLHLPVQNLLAIGSMNTYYEYTGNTDFLKMVYPSIKDYLNLWQINEDGLTYGTGNYYFDLMRWYDSQGESDTSIAENIWYYYALKNACDIASALELESDVLEYKDKMQRISNGINNNYWDGIGYKSDDFNGYDSRANSVAILSGIADESKYESIYSVIKENYDNSVLMEKYVLEALCKMGKIEDAESRILFRYEGMINSQDFSTTLWEYWNNDVGSKNHAWAGSPLIIMSKYFAGIQPLKPGYSEVLIKPNFGTLNKMSSSVSTVKGNISLSANKLENEIDLEISTPSKTLVAVEKISNDFNININNTDVYKNGAQINFEIAKFEKEDSKYIYLYLEPGEYKIISK